MNGEGWILLGAAPFLGLLSDTGVAWVRGDTGVARHIHYPL